ncbi:MAG TPA: branched-chain amino acid ABC transporter permease [Thermodesulfobacteriota bacterium]|nr:branched-chain amino acid ABC transporter permease [Thermodesulfobacteriota bacterium]
MLLFLQSLMNGLLLGGIYAAYSAGFSLIFGVMGVINIFHGEMVMLGAFLTYWLFTLFHVDPFLTLPLSFFSLFLLGYLVQRFVIHRVVDAPPMISYILTFGIHLIIAYTALWVWTADFRTVTTSYSGWNADLGGVIIPYARLATFGLALAVVAGLYFLLNKTEAGRAIQATAQDEELARLMGVNITQTFALTFGLGAAITGVAGSLISTYFVIFPQMGLPYTIIAFCVVVLGGMGYVPGALWGGLILGVVQSLTATYLNAGLSGALTFILLFIVLIVRPAGIAGKGIVD